MKLLKNSLYNMTYQILSILMPIITVPYISRVLGETGVGKQAFTLAFAQYFVLVGSIGLNVYGNRQIAYERDNEKRLRDTFWELFYLRFALLFITTIIYYVTFVGINKVDRTIYAIQGLNILAALIDISWYFMGLEDFKKTVNRNILVKIIGVICIFIWVNDRGDIGKYVLILSLSQFLGQLAMWTNIPKFLSYKDLDKIEIKEHFKCALRLFVPQLAAQFYLLIDRIMLGFMVGEASVGLYESSQKIIRLAMPIVTSIGVVMIPRMSNLYAKGKLDEFKEFIYKVFSIMNFISIPITFGIISIVSDFKPWFFGDDFNGINTLIIVSSFIVIFGTWCNVLGFQVLIPMKREREFTISVVSAAILNVIMNIILINKIGALGTTISSTIAELIVPMIQLYYLRKFINIKKLFSGVSKFFISSVIMMIVVLSISIYLKPSIISTLIEVVVGGTTYCLLLLVSRDKNLMFLISRIKERVSRF